MKLLIYLLLMVFAAGCVSERVPAPTNDYLVHQIETLQSEAARSQAQIAAMRRAIFVRDIAIGIFCVLVFGPKILYFAKKVKPSNGPGLNSPEDPNPKEVPTTPSKPATALPLPPTPNAVPAANVIQANVPSNLIASMLSPRIVLVDCKSIGDSGPDFCLERAASLGAALETAGLQYVCIFDTIQRQSVVRYGRELEGLVFKAMLSQKGRCFSQVKGGIINAQVSFRGAVVLTNNSRLKAAICKKQSLDPSEFECQPVSVADRKMSVAILGADPVPVLALNDAVAAHGFKIPPVKSKAKQPHGNGTPRVLAPQR